MTGMSLPVIAGDSYTNFRSMYRATSNRPDASQ
jgi:hypothetical protein